MPTRTRLPAVLRRGPFTTAQALAAGVSVRSLHGPAVVQLFRDVHLAADVAVTLQHRVAGALLVLPPGTAVGGVTALQLLGLDVGPSEPLSFWTTWPHQVRRPGLRVTRVAELLPVRRAQLSGPAIFRTAAADLGLVDLTAAGDFLCRRGLATIDDLREVGETGRRGTSLVRRAASLVRERVDSPRETRLRLTLTMAQLPEPEVIVPFHAADGRFLGTPDLTYRRWMTALEYEGDQHRTDPRQWAYDLSRYEQMGGAGLHMIRVAKEHLRRARKLVLRVDEVLRGRGYTGPAPTFDAEWVSLFGLGAR